MELAVAILTGGLGTRLHPLTATTPKSLIDVAGMPFISHQLHYLRQQGIRKVVLCVGHLGEQIEAVVGNGHAFDLEVRYSWDGLTLLGTGGALRQALPLLGRKFFILYGDSYLPINFNSVQQAFQQQGKPALMTVFKNNNQWDKSNVLFKEQLLIEYNKYQTKEEMEHIDYGLSILTASALDHFSGQDTFDLAELYFDLAERNQLAGYEVFERFYEIGSHQGLLETNDHYNKYLALKKDRNHLS